MKIKKDKDFMLKVLSLLFAVILWSYVRSDGNIIITRNFRNIEVTYEGQEDLKNKNLTIISPKEFLIDVELKGYNSYMRTASRDGISAKVNLSKLDEGEHSVPISVSYIDGGITVSKISQKTIPFKIDRMVSESVNADIVVNGTPQEGYLVGSIRDFEPVKVKGASTLVNKVDSLRFEVDVTDLKESSYINSKAEAFDSNGNVVEGLVIEPSSIKLEIPIQKVKTVPIVLDYKNSAPEKVSISNFTMEPSSVTIIGNSNLVDSLDKISTYPVDLSGIDKELEIKLKIPENIQVVEGIDRIKLIKVENN